MSDSHLDRAPDHNTLEVLRRADLIAPERYWAALRELNPADRWAHYASRLLLLVGSALVLAAVIFFFAYNWDGLGRWQKMGILQVSVILSLAAGQYVGFGRLVGQLFLFAASILIGVSLAVFGQIYQTGADAFGFFAMWALFIVPWMVASAFAPLWVLGVILINLAIWFFWGQVGQFHDQFHYVYVCAALTVINGGALFARETLYASRPWLRGPWLRPLFLLGTTVPLTLPAYAMAVGFNSHSLLTIGTLLWLGTLGKAFIFFCFQHFDATCLSLILANAAIFLLLLFGRLLGNASIFDGGWFLIMTAATIGMAALLAKLVRMLCVAQHANEGDSA